MARIVSALVILSVASASVWADVVPSRYADPEARAAREAVQGRLEGLGVASPAEQAGALTDAEARYFLQAPERLQLAGQAEAAEDATIGSGEKVVYGILFLVGTIAGVTVWHLAND